MEGVKKFTVGYTGGEQANPVSILYVNSCYFEPPLYELLHLHSFNCITNEMPTNFIDRRIKILRMRPKHA